MSVEPNFVKIGQNIKIMRIRKGVTQSELAKKLGISTEEFDEIIGLDRLKAIHINDSMNPIGSHKDRHQKIGEGTIGITNFEKIINHPVLKDLPFYLETPNEDIIGYAKEIELLRNLYID